MIIRCKIFLKLKLKQCPFKSDWEPILNEIDVWKTFLLPLVLQKYLQIVIRWLYIGCLCLHLEHVLYCDSTSVMTITKNLVLHLRKKHIKVKYISSIEFENTQVRRMLRHLIEILKFDFALPWHKTRRLKETCPTCTLPIIFWSFVILIHVGI